MKLTPRLYLFFLNEYGDNECKSGDQHETAERDLPAQPVEDEKNEGVGRNLHGRGDEEVDVRISSLLKICKKGSFCCFRL